MSCCHMTKWSKWLKFHSLFNIKCKSIFEAPQKRRKNLLKHLSKHWPMLSIGQNVRLSVRLFVRLSVCSLLRLRLNVFLAPLPKVGCPRFFRNLESLGKSNEKKWYQIWAFLFENCLKSPRKKSLLFLLILPYKPWWKPCFPMD